MSRDNVTLKKLAGLLSIKTRKKKALYLSTFLIVSILSTCKALRVLKILRPVVIIKVIKTA